MRSERWQSPGAEICNPLLAALEEGMVGTSETMGNAGCGPSSTAVGTELPGGRAATMTASALAMQCLPIKLTELRVLTNTMAQQRACTFA